MTEDVRAWMRGVHRVAVPLAFVLLGAACSESSLEIVCSQEARPSLVVTVQDSVSVVVVAEPLVWVQAMSFVDTLEVVDAGIAAGPYERPGVYDVHVEEPGYLDWLKRDVEVRQGRCHVLTELVEARLQPGV